VDGRLFHCHEQYASDGCQSGTWELLDSGTAREAENGQTTDAYCRELLGVPDGYALEAILSVGVPSECPEPHRADELETEKVHYETWTKQ